MKISGDISTLVWDLDGTIIDSIAVMEAVLASILPAYGREMPSHETILHHVHGSMEDIINNSLGGIDLDELDALVNNFRFAQNEHYASVGIIFFQMRSG